MEPRGSGSLIDDLRKFASRIKLQLMHAEELGRAELTGHSSSSNSAAGSGSVGSTGYLREKHASQ